MNIYYNEAEQIEHIKNWFKRYGKLITFMIFAVLAIIAGYRLWLNHDLKIKSQASARYERLMLGVANQDDGLINAEANNLIENYPETIYAQAALLMQAKLALHHNDTASALDKLNQVMLKSSDNAFRQTARIRSARILESRNDYQKALALLSTVEDEAYMPLINEIKGDLYFALNQPEKARTYYRKAMKGFPEAGLYSPLLEMKLNEIEINKLTG